MLLLAYNAALIKNRERTYLTSPITAADTSITVAATDLAPDASASDTWADNDYILVGDFGTDTTEILQVNGAVTSATSITIDREGQSGGARFAHPVGTPVYRLAFNRVEFSNGSSDSTASLTVLATIRIQPDDLFTRYDDTTNSTGYGFVRFNNQTTATFSAYSDGVNYDQTGVSSSRDPRTLFSMRKKVRQLLQELDENRSVLTNDMIREALNDKQRDVGHSRLWSFYEGERSFSAVADQFAYDIPNTVQTVHTVRFDTQPAHPATRNEWDRLHWDTDQSVTSPYNFHVWNGQVLFEPRPSTDAASTQLDGALTATDTSMTVDDSSDFKRGDYYRMVIDDEVIYATAATSTTFTGLLRGREGTTAATHADDATVTERDIVYSTHEEPTDLIDISDRTNVREPDVLVYGAAIDLAPMVNKENLIATFEAKYESKFAELEDKYAQKHTGYFTGIKDYRDVAFPRIGLSPANMYPKDINI